MLLELSGFQASGTSSLPSKYMCLCSSSALTHLLCAEHEGSGDSWAGTKDGKAVRLLGEVGQMHIQQSFACKCC
jgi:hypothetical protein